jgi:hypothetical protein
MTTVSRRDDIEALAYVLIELLVGELPWTGATSAKVCYIYTQIRIFSYFYVSSLGL